MSSTYGKASCPPLPPARPPSRPPSPSLLVLPPTLASQEDERVQEDRLRLYHLLEKERREAKMQEVSCPSPFPPSLPPPLLPSLPPFLSPCPWFGFLPFFPSLSSPSAQTPPFASPSVPPSLPPSLPPFLPPFLPVGGPCGLVLPPLLLPSLPSRFGAGIEA
jgi:hypothetical protein